MSPLAAHIDPKHISYRCLMQDEANDNMVQEGFSGPTALGTVLDDVFFSQDGGQGDDAGNDYKAPVLGME